MYKLYFKYKLIPYTKSLATVKKVIIKNILLILLILSSIGISCIDSLARETATVTIKEFNVSEAGPFKYVGPAVKNLLETRLFEEGLIIKSEKEGAETNFSLTGSVREIKNGVEIELNLINLQNKKIERWSVIPPSLNNLVSEVEARSIDISSSISQQMLAAKESKRKPRNRPRRIRPQYSDKKEKDRDRVLQDESLKVSRMHPDRMLHEKNVAVTPASEAIGAEGAPKPTVEEKKDGWSLWPWDHKDDNKQSENIDELDRKTLYVKNLKELPFPPPEQEPKPLNIKDTEVQEGHTRSKGWFSWMWPWGDDYNETDTVKENMSEPKNEKASEGIEFPKEVYNKTEKQPGIEEGPVWKWN